MKNAYSHHSCKKRAQNIFERRDRKNIAAVNSDLSNQKSKSCYVTNPTLFLGKFPYFVSMRDFKTHIFKRNCIAAHLVIFDQI